MATFFPVGRRNRRHAELPGRLLIVRHEPLQVPDRQRRTLLRQHALAFALVLLRANPSRDRRQGIVLANFPRRADIIPRQHQVHKVLDLHPHRARGNAGSLLARQAALCLDLRYLLGKAKVDLFEVAAAFHRVLLRHVLPLNFHPIAIGERVMRWHRRPPVSPPLPASPTDSARRRRGCADRASISDPPRGWQRTCRANASRLRGTYCCAGSARRS